MIKYGENDIAEIDYGANDEPVGVVTLDPAIQEKSNKAVLDMAYNSPQAANWDIIDKDDYENKGNDFEQGVWGKIKESFSRGSQGWLAQYGLGGALVEGDEFAKAKAMVINDNVLNNERLHPIDANWFTDIIYSGVRVSGQVWETMKRGGRGAAIAGGAGAVIGGVAGALFPTVGEEPAAIMGGTIGGLKIGAKLGLAEGAAIASYRQGIGEMYYEQVKSGADPEIAANISAIFSIPYAILELSQVKTLAPNIKRALAKKLQASAMKVTLEFGKKYGKTWSKAVWQEVEQKGISILAKDTTNVLMDNDVPVSAEEITKRLTEILEEAKGAAKGMALLSLTGATIETGIEVVGAQKIDLAPVEVKAETPSPAAEAPSVPVAGQTAETAAIEPGAEGKPTTGKPFETTAYHGSQASFTEFDLTKLGSKTGATSAKMAVFASKDIATAASSQYADPDVEIKSILSQVGQLTDRQIIDLVVLQSDAMAITPPIPEYGGKLGTRAKQEAWLRQQAEEGGWAIETSDVQKVIPDFSLQPNLKQVRVKLDNPLVEDMQSQRWGPETGKTFTQVIERAKAAGHDGVIFRNVSDGADITDVYAVFDPQKIVIEKEVPAGRFDEPQKALQPVPAAEAKPMTKEEWTTQPDFIPAETEIVSVRSELAKAQEELKTAKPIDAVFIRESISDYQKALKTGKETFEQPIGEPPLGYTKGSLNDKPGFVKNFYKEYLKQLGKQIPAPAPAAEVQQAERQAWEMTREELKANPTVFWHGSPSGDMRGGKTGLHIGTYLAAKQALEARIGIPAEGEWDGTREYGKTLLAGKKTLKTKSLNETGVNAGEKVPQEDYYPTGEAKYSDGSVVPMTVKPNIAPVKITGEMTNTPQAPHGDFKANALMAGQLKRGKAKRGYYYKQVGEDEGSISAVVPGKSHIEIIQPAQEALGKGEGEKAEGPARDILGDVEPIQQINKALKEAREKRPLLEAERKTELKRRVAAAAGFVKGKLGKGEFGEKTGQISTGLLKGELSNQRYESIREKMEESMPGAVRNAVASIWNADYSYFDALDIDTAFQKLLDGIPITLRQVDLIKAHFGLEMGEIAKTRAEVSSLADRLWTLWRANLLTGLKSWGPASINNLSNLAHGVTEVGKDYISAPADIVASWFTGKREVGLTVKGIPSGMKEGAQKGWDYLKTGIEERPIAEKFDLPRDKINFGDSKTGKILQVLVDTVFHVYGAEDQPFFYGAMAHSIRSQAIASGRTKKLKGAEFAKHIDDLVQKPTDAMLENAVEDAEQAVFQNETMLGDIAKIMQKAPVVRWLVPFSRTPSAVATQIVNYTPVGLVKEIADEIHKGKFNQRKFVQAFGRAGVGTAALFIGTLLYKVGMITLGYPKSERERKLWELEGRKENSIKIGNKWRSVFVLGPVGNVLLIGGYFQQALEESGSPSEAIVTAMSGGAKSLTEQTFVTGMSQAIDAIKDPERSFDRFFSSMAGSAVPTIIADFAKATDEIERKSTGPWERIVSRLPGARQTLEPRVDVFGQDLPRYGGNPLEVMIDATRPSKIRQDIVVDEIRRLWDRDVRVAPTELGNRDGYKILTPEENTVLWRRAGQLTYRGLFDLIQQPYYKTLSDEAKGKQIEKEVKKAKDLARAEVAKIKLNQGHTMEELREDGLVIEDVEKLINIFEIKRK